MSLCYKLWFHNPYICRPKTMISVKSINLRLKYQRFTPLGCINIGIRKVEFKSKIQFLSLKFIPNFNPSPFYIFVKINFKINPTNVWLTFISAKLNIIYISIWILNPAPTPTFRTFITIYLFTASPDYTTEWLKVIFYLININIFYFFFFLSQALFIEMLWKFT